MSKKFLSELKEGLPKGSKEKRKRWARHIVENEIDILDLSSLLKEELAIARGFSWLLAEIAEEYPNEFLKVSSDLFRLCPEISHFNFTESFAYYWMVAGVPEENEGEAVEVLFSLLQDSEVKVYIKSRCVTVLFRLSQKYPDIIGELREHLLQQRDNHSPAFAKKVDVVLLKLEQV